MLEYQIGETKFNVPQGWHEVTVKQFQEYVRLKRDDLNYIVKKICIFTGIDDSLLFNTVRSMEENQLLLMAFDGLKDWPDLYEVDRSPALLKIDNKEIDYKNINIQLCTMAQYSTFAGLILPNARMNEDRFFVNLFDIQKAIAIYCYPAWSGKDYSTEWDTMLTVIDSMNILEAFSTASFFLNVYINSQSTGAKNLSTTPTQKKTKQELKSSTNSES